MTVDYSNLYGKMVLIRTLETKFLDLAKTTGEISDLHLMRGEEAIPVGVCAALRKDDYMVTHHRTIAHSIAKGMELQPLVDEILGRSTGICGGRSNEMHIRDPSIGYMFSFQLVGTGAPVSAGVAWASRYVKKEDKVTALFIGDAATGNAQFFEGMNAAALRKVPLLVVIEDNHLAGNITPNYYFPERFGMLTTIEDRLNAFSIPSLKIDGNKIDQVVMGAQEIIGEIREAPRPFALICDTTRLLMHKIGQGDVRTPEQIAELEKRDPLRYAEQMLHLNALQILEIQKDANDIVCEAIDKAHAAPFPDPEEYFKDE